MRILFYSHTGKVSGAENILLLLLKRLNRARFSPQMICPAEGGLADKVRALEVPVVAVDELNARFTWRIDRLVKYAASFYTAARQLRRLTVGNEAEIIHANSIRAGLAAWAATLFTRKLIFWHLQDELPNHPFSTAIRSLTLCSSRIRLIAVSAATGESFQGKLLRRFGKRIPLRVVHNAVEIERFPNDSECRPKIRAELGVTESETVFGIIGQITPRKGQLELIEAFAENRERLSDATLLIVGMPMFNQDFEYLEQLKQAAVRLGIENEVRFLGQRNDIPAVMKALDALVVNSKSEALVVVAIEAMACGTPVIATDVGGTREIIENGVNGWLIPFGEPKELGAALCECAAEPGLRRSFGETGRRIVHSRLNADKFIRDIEQFFRNEDAEPIGSGVLGVAEN